MIDDHKKSAYTSADIKVLKGLEAVQKRPGMYIGNVEDGSGLHHMIYEVLDNAVDESIAGYCSEITVKLYEDGSASVQDNGRGIPTDWHAEENRPTPELILTTLHSGGKFDNKSYSISGGLHGVGLSVVNALSIKLMLRICRDGQVYTQEFIRGEPKPHTYQESHEAISGTLVHFYPDQQVFGEVNFDPSVIQAKLEEVAYLNPKLKLNFDYHNQVKTFYSENGLEEYVQHLSKKFIPSTTILNFVTQTSEGDKVLMALRWCRDFHEEKILCYTNNIVQNDGGSHLTGLKSGIVKAVGAYLAKDYSNNKQIKNIAITGDDMRSGLVAVLSISTPNPAFSSQTKEKLVSSHLRQLVDKCVHEHLYDFLITHVEEAQAIVEKTIISAKARESARTARDMQRKALGQPTIVSSLTGKLVFCQEKDPRKAELFLVEGESAGGSAKQARNRAFQAVLPLKGKILNVEKADTETALQSLEIVQIIQAIGCGLGENCDGSKARYHKVIIMTDADTDGEHICTLILTLFYRYLKSVIEHGFLYIAQPPLYSFQYRGKEIYVRDEQQLRTKMIELAMENSSLTVKNQALSGLELQNMLAQHSTIENIKYQVRSSFPGAIIDALCQAGDRQVNTWWKKLAKSLQLQGYRSITRLDQQLIQAEFEGNQRTYDLSRITESNYYHTLLNAFDVINQYNKLKVDVTVGRNSRRGLNIHAALACILELNKSGRVLKRYKGLGEMDAGQLWPSTMDPTSRRLLNVTIEDARKADEVFSILMGSEVSARREFITQNAAYVNFQISS